MKPRILAALLLALGFTAPPLFAQGGAGSTGSIQGDVVDESGAVLPGVTVTATGPALIGTQTATTNAQGIYRFLGLPAGTYKLTFELPGFGTVVREDIRIGIGFTATVNTKLALKSLSEEVTVTGESPTIDTTATRVQTNFDKTQLDSLPNARDMWSLLAETPAVTLNRFDVGGSTAGTQTTYVAYGNGGQNRPLIEGINTTEGTSAAGLLLRLRLLRRGDHRRRGQLGRDAERRRAHQLHRQVRRQPVHAASSTTSTRTRTSRARTSRADQLARGFANIPRNVIQHARPEARRGQHAARLQEPQRQRRRSDHQGQALVLGRLPAPGERRLPAARGRDPGRHGVPDQARELHGQADLPDDAPGQVHRPTSSTAPSSSPSAPTPVVVGPAAPRPRTRR